MKWRRRHLECEPDEEQQHAGEQEWIDGDGGLALNRRRDLCQLSVAGLAVDERHAEEQESGGEAAEQQILQRRFLRAFLAPREDTQHAERQLEQLNGQEDDHQARRPGEQHHPKRGGEDERVVLAVMQTPPVEIVRADHDHEPGAHQQDRVDEERETVVGEGAGVDQPAGIRVEPRPDGDSERGRDANKGDAREPRASRRWDDQIQEHEQQERATEDKLREDPDEVSSAGKRQRDRRGRDQHHCVAGFDAAGWIRFTTVLTDPVETSVMGLGYSPMKIIKATSGTSRSPSPMRRSCTPSVRGLGGSCIKPWWSRSMYQAAMITPPPARTAYTQLSWNAPSMIVNSPTKLFMPGMPRPASVATRKKKYSHGIRRSRPDSSPMSRVPVRASTKPTMRKSALMMMPWLIIWITAPLIPLSVSEKMPRAMKPRWLMLAYATMRLRSRSDSAISAP